MALLLLLLSASPYSGSPQRDSNLHFTRSTSSPSLAPTLSMSSIWHYISKFHNAIMVKLSVRVTLLHIKDYHEIKITIIVVTGFQYNDSFDFDKYHIYLLTFLLS